MTIVGTNHFINESYAITYYGDYGFSEADVKSKLRDGEIKIGRPSVPKDGILLNNLREGRYSIQLKD